MNGEDRRIAGTNCLSERDEKVKSRWDGKVGRMTGR